MQTADLEQRLEDLEEHKRKLTLRSEIAELEHGLKLLEAVGDYIDPTWQFQDQLGRYTVPAGYVGDRREGANGPTFTTEEELQVIRGNARVIADGNPYALGALQNLTNYVIGTGYTYTAVGQRNVDVPAALVEAAQRCVDEFLEENEWDARERELFRRARRDGEYFLRFFHTGAGHVRVRVIEPEQVTDTGGRPIPDDLDGRPTSWRFGVHTDSQDVETVLGYSVLWDYVSDVEYVPAEQVQHVKVNVDANIKRGLSDFFPVTGDFDGARKLLRNTRDGAALQAAIAWIEQYPPATRKDTVTAANSSNTDWTKRRFSRTSDNKTADVRRVDPATILQISAGKEFLPGPMGSQRAPNFMLVLQGALRGIAVRWSMPEAMISGDASNANYASSLVAESPFIKAVEFAQAFQSKRYRQVIWRALRIASDAGRFNRWGVGWHQLRRVIDLQVDTPIAEARQRDIETTRRAQMHQAGLLSRRTWSAMENLDYDVEQENLKRESGERPEMNALQGAMQGAMESAAESGGGITDLLQEFYP